MDNSAAAGGANFNDPDKLSGRFPDIHVGASCACTEELFTS